MDISKIKEFYKQMLDYSILDERDELLMAIAEYIIKSEKLNTTYMEPPESYVSLKECEKILGFVCANTIQKYCINNPEFKKECAHFDGYKWNVDPLKTENFLRNKSIFKNRLKRLQGDEWEEKLKNFHKRFECLKNI